VRWTTEHEQASWWIHGLRPFNDHVVGSIVPAGFEAVARVFHPLRAETGELESWAAMAERNGRLVHPEMQLHAIATPTGQTVNNGEALRLVNHLTLTGELPEAETGHLAELMATHTETPWDCHFGVWDGYGDLHRAPSLLRRGIIRQPTPGPGLLPDYVAEAGSVGPSQRRYFLLNGALADIDEPTRAGFGQRPRFSRARDSLGIAWPR